MFLALQREIESPSITKIIKGELIHYKKHKVIQGVCCQVFVAAVSFSGQVLQVYGKPIGFLDGLFVV